MREETGCESLLEGGDSRKGCCVWEVEVGESHFGDRLIWSI